MGAPIHPLVMIRMTSPVVAAVDGRRTIAIVVLGAQEQHGKHLPLATDALRAEHLARMMAERLGDALVAPVVPVGVPPKHMIFAGAISLRTETLGAIVGDYLASLEQHGFLRVVVLPSRGGNFAPMVDILPGLWERHPGVRMSPTPTSSPWWTRWRPSRQASALPRTRSALTRASGKRRRCSLWSRPRRIRTGFRPVT